ncbi:MAG TPA: type II toxin-antitoxin system death-on-curing family toxin [Coleofasciculaceae cyanobacterium]
MLTPEFIEKEDVVRIHDDQLETYGGQPGILSEHTLTSAIAQPCATWDGKFLHPTVFDQAAAYLFHIANAHAFVDGNKRTGFAVMVTFLEINGYYLELSEDDAYRLSMSVVTVEGHTSRTKDDIARILESCCIFTATANSPTPSLEL